MVGVKDEVINNINYLAALLSWFTDGGQCCRDEGERRFCCEVAALCVGSYLHSNWVICLI
ncbi:hypothetical protein LAC02_39080 [Ligilactobacillus acidipiscis]|nr:hypothetical protein LAC02_39080 [Ligilactobacillus acidipiscis]